MLVKIVNFLKKFVSNVLHRTEYVGLENIDKEKLYIFAANHVGALDPAYIMNVIDNLAIMAKAELFKKPIVREIVIACGAFPIERGKKDVKAVLHASRVITDERKNLLIFPEGTRKANRKGVRAKDGAVCIAEIAGVDIIPVHITEKQGLFKKYTVKFGKPMSVNIEQNDKEDIKAVRQNLTKELMERIYSMRDENE